MYGQRPMGRGPLAGGLGGLGGPVPRDVIVLLAVVFGTFSIDILMGGGPVPVRAGLWFLRLTPELWQLGFVWQAVTYPFVGYGSPNLWILLELLILFWFSKDVFWRLGRKRFWQTVAWAVVGAAAVAVVVELLLGLFNWFHPLPFVLMQGQRTLITISIAAFATIFADATIYLFFVLPIRARWFLWIEILFAFVFFLGTRDLAGFLGICTAVGVTWSVLRHGGPTRGLRRAWLRLRNRQLQWQLERTRKKRGFRVVRGGEDEDRWLN